MSPGSTVIGLAAYPVINSVNISGIGHSDGSPLHGEYQCVVIFSLCFWASEHADGAGGAL